MDINDDFDCNVITLLDDQNIEHDFEILDIIQQHGREFYALTPATEEDALDDDELDYFILEAINQNGESTFQEIENLEFLNQLADKFDSRFKDLLSEISDEENF